MMEDYDRTMELVGITENSTGRSQEQFEKNAESLEFKLQELSTAWEQFRLSLTKSETIGKVVDLLTGFVDTLNEIVDSPAKLLGLGTAFVVLGKTISESLLSAIKSTSNIGSSIGGAIATKVQSFIQKRIFKIPIDFTAKSSNIQKEIDRLKSEIKSLTNDTIKGQLESELDQAKKELLELNSLAWQQDSKEGQSIVQEQIEKTKQKIQELENELDDVNSGTKLAKLNAELKELENQAEEASKKTGASFSKVLADKDAQKKIGQAAGQAFSVAFATAATQIITDQNPFDVLIQSLITTATTAIPLFASTATKAIQEVGLKAALTEATVTAGISVVIQLVIGLLSFGIQWLRSIESAEERSQRMAETYAKVAENSSKVAESTKEMAQNTKEAAEEGEKLKKEYEELANKTEKTEEEQERYNELISEIQEKYGEVVTYYNETTNQLTLQTEKWDRILEQQRESAELQRKIAGETERENLSTQAYNKMMNDILGFENKYGVSLDYNTKSQLISQYFVNPAGATVALEEQLLGTTLFTNESRQYFEAMLKEWEDVLDDLRSDFKDSYIQQYQDLNPNAGESESTLYGYLAAAMAEGYNDLIPTIQRAVIEQTAGDKGTITLGGEDEQLSRYETSSAIQSIEVEGKRYSWTEKEIAQIVYDAFNNDKAAAQKWWDTLTEAERVVFLFQQGQESVLQQEMDELYEKLGPRAESLSILVDKAIAGNQTDINNLYKEIQDLSTMEGTAGLNDLFEEISKNRQALVDKLATYIPNIATDSISSADLQTFVNLIESRIGAGVSNRMAGDFYSEIYSKLLKEHLTDEQILQAMGSVDWAQVSLGNLQATEEDFINTLNEITDGALGPDKAHEIWNTFFEQSQEFGIVDIEIRSVGDLSQIKEDLTSYLEDTLKSASNIQSIVKNQLTNGQINYSDKRKLEEELANVSLNAEDYLTATSTGYMLDTQALQEAYNQRIQNEDEILEYARNQVKAGIAELEQERTLINALATEEDIDGSLLSQEFERLKISDRLTYNALVRLGRIEEAEKILKGTEGIILNIDKAETEDALENLDNTIDNLTAILADDELLKAYIGYNDMTAANAELNEDFAETIKNVTENLSEESNVASDLTEKIKDLNEALYGEKNHKNQLDYLYNYTTALDRLNDAASLAKDSLDNLQADDNVDALLSEYTSKLSSAASVREAENRILEQSIANYQATLTNDLAQRLQSINALNPDYQVSTNTSDYFSYDDLSGAWLVNYEALNSAQIPDDFSDFVENSIDQMNKWQSTIMNNIAEDRKALAEVKKMQSDALTDIVTLEDEVRDILKNKYQEEIDDLKDKYSAMSDANDDYLSALQDAIQKERDLRDRENAYEDLATKEKKLSLLQRDTSGANQKDILSLLQEVENDRQQLLDETVDDILETMKEMYESQKEDNDKQIEILESMLDEVTLMKEVTAIISGWTSSDDMITWMFENNGNIESLSEAKLEQEMLNWTTMFDEANAAQKTLDRDLVDEIKSKEDDVATAIQTYSQTATSAASLTINSASDTVKTAIATAQKAIEDALKALQTDTEGNDSDNSSNNGNKNNNITTRAEYWTNKINNAKSGMERDAIDKAARWEGYSYDNERGYVKNIKAGVSNAADKTKIIEEQQSRPSIADTVLLMQEENITGISSGYITSQPLFQIQADLNPPKSQIIVETTDGYYVADNWSDKGTRRDLRFLAMSNKINDKSEVVKAVDSNGLFDWKEWWHTSWGQQRSYFGYKHGGLVDYTGPAQVHGTPSRPEAFLSAEDTKHIGLAAQLFSESPLLNSANAENAVSSSIGDTSIEIYINVESLSNDYDVDQLIERVHQDIIDVANPTGTPVILHKN